MFHYSILLKVFQKEKNLAKDFLKCNILQRNVNNLQTFNKMFNVKQNLTLSKM